MKTSTSNNLKELRIKTGILQSDLAQKLGLQSTNRISLWEQGKLFPHVINLFKMAGHYKVFPHELFNDLWKELSGLSDKEIHTMHFRKWFEYVYTDGMKISDEQLDSFIALYEKEYGETITRVEAHNQIVKLVELMKALYWEE